LIHVFGDKMKKVFQFFWTSVDARNIRKFITGIPRATTHAARASHEQGGDLIQELDLIQGRDLTSPSSNKPCHMSQ
jgi:hypothetical protein